MHSTSELDVAGSSAQGARPISPIPLPSFPERSGSSSKADSGVPHRFTRDPDDYDFVTPRPVGSPPPPPKKRKTSIAKTLKTCLEEHGFSKSLINGAKLVYYIHYAID